MDDLTPRPAIDLDGLSDSEACRVLQAEFPRWTPWRGVNHLVYARKLMTSPPKLVRGEDWTDLRDMLRRAEAQ